MPPPGSRADFDRIANVAHRPRLVGDGMARPVIGRVAPLGLARDVRRMGQVEAAIDLVRHREGGQLERVRRPRRSRAFEEEQQPPEGDLGDRGVDLLGGVEHRRRRASAAEARVGARLVAKRREQQIMEARAFRRHGRLGGIEQLLERVLLVGIVDQLHRRDAVLCLDHSPDRAGPGAGVGQVRQARAGRPDRRASRSGR